MNKNQIIPILFVAVILFLVFMNFAEEDKISATIGGEEESFLSKWFKGLIPADVGGILAEGGEELDVWTYKMAPGSSGTINVGVYNTFSTHTWYKVSVKENGNTIYISSQEFVAPGSDYDWFFTYNAPSTPGDYLIKMDSFKKNPFSDTLYQFDDSDHFTIRVVDDAPPDPCEGVSCPSKCVGETYYYAGYCVGGDCEYKTAQTVGKCGYTLPEPDDTPEPDPEPDDTPVPDPVNPCEGVTCLDKCVEPYTRLYDGVCIDGTCDYTEEASSTNCGYVEPTPAPESAPSSGDGEVSSTTTPVAPDERDPTIDIDYTASPEDVPTGAVDDLFEDLPINIYGVSAIGLSVLGIAAYLINARRKI